MVQPPRVLLCAAVWFTGACEPATQRDAPSTTTRLDRPQQWTFAPGLTVALRAWPARARVGTPLVVTLEPEGQEVGEPAWKKQKGRANSSGEQGAVVGKATMPRRLLRQV